MHPSVGQGLNGMLLTDLFELPMLNVLDLSFNDFAGPLPAVYGRLQSLQLQWNVLSEEIPDGFWSEAAALETLNLGANGLTGTLSPTGVTKATNLKYLELFDNRLVGALASEIGRLDTLIRVQLQQNGFSGALPDLGTLAWATSLKELRLDDNAFVGTLPASVGELSELTDLRVSRNQFSGPMPSELANIPNLVNLELNFNQFDGSVPSELCVPADVLLTFLQADCLSNPCDCCTHCCNRDEETCRRNKDEEAYRAIFAEAVGDAVFQEGTAHDVAAKWIIYEDPASLSLDSPNLVQRYIMAFFYYHTSDNGNRRWRSCNPPRGSETAECSFLQLVDIEEIVDKDDLTFEVTTGNRWLSEKSECEWTGVECDQVGYNNVTGVKMRK
jgi:hypothetical protein